MYATMINNPSNKPHPKKNTLAGIAKRHEQLNYITGSKFPNTNEIKYPNDVYVGFDPTPIYPVVIPSEDENQRHIIYNSEPTNVYFEKVNVVDGNKYSHNEIGVLVVNMNQLNLTRKCIEDLMNQMDIDSRWIINKNQNIFLFDQNSNEKGTAEFLRECENNGIKVFRNTAVLPLNHIWNNFKNICFCEYLCFLNNDVELSNLFMCDTLKIFGLEPKVGFVIHVTNHPEYLKTKAQLDYTVLNPAYYQGWDFTIRRNLMPEIPKQLIVFGGDDYVFAKVVNLGHKVALAYSSPIIHHSGITRKTIPTINEIQRVDSENFNKILENEHIRQINITTNVGLCRRIPEMGMKILPLAIEEGLFYIKPFDYYLDKIKKNEHFKYSRFNDGELIAIIGNTPNEANCDGHQYFPNMSVELRKILLNYKHDENYILESFYHWYDRLPHTKKIMDELKTVNPELSYLSYDFIRITYENNPADFRRLLTELKSKKLVIVGPAYLKDLSVFFDFKFIEVPLKNCYLAKDEIIRQINEINEKSENNYYLFSASMATKVIIEAFKNDKNNTYIDWGSAWDGFFVAPKYGFIHKRSSSNHPRYLELYKDYLIN